MMKQQDYKDELAAVRRCLDAYGGDIARWPASARERWGELVRHEGVGDDRADADAIDALLSAATAPQTPHDLKNRIEAGYRPPSDKSGDFLTGLSVLSGWLKPLPAGALASLTALGFVVAAVTGGDTTLPPEYEAFAYLEESGFAVLDDEAGALWDAE